MGTPAATADDSTAVPGRAHSAAAAAAAAANCHATCRATAAAAAAAAVAAAAAAAAGPARTEGSAQAEGGLQPQDGAGIHRLGHQFALLEEEARQAAAGPAAHGSGSAAARPARCRRV